MQGRGCDWGTRSGSGRFRWRLDNSQAECRAAAGDNGADWTGARVLRRAQAPGAGVEHGGVDAELLLKRSRTSNRGSLPSLATMPTRQIRVQVSAHCGRCVLFRKFARSERPLSACLDFEQGDGVGFEVDGEVLRVREWTGVRRDGIRMFDGWRFREACGDGVEGGGCSLR